MAEVEETGDTRRFRLSAGDVVLMVNLGIVLLGAVAFIESQHDSYLLSILVWMVASVTLTACASWLGKRHKAPPPLPSTNPARRTGAMLLLSIGGIVSLIGLVLALAMVSSLLSGTEDIPLPTIPLAFLPLIFGQSLMYAGARLRLEPR